MTHHRDRIIRAATALLAVLLTGCSMSSGSSTPLASSTSSPAPSSTAPPASVAASTAPSLEPSVAPTQAPDPSTVPLYPAGATVQTHIAGLRVHARPGTEERVVTGLLPDAADLLVALGPIFVDGYGWYLVDDVDAGDPAFTQGWVAAGFNPDPWLVPAAFAVPNNPYLGGWAGDADGEYGPVHLTDANVQVNWIAAPPNQTGCSFHVDLRRGGNDPVPAIRSTIGAVVAPGVLYSDFFVDQPELVGDLFVEVTSDCRWALTFEQLYPATPTPRPSP